VFYLLPAIRRELAIALKKRGADQRTIARYLGITDAAVSQYISGKRGTECALPKEFSVQICGRAKLVNDVKSAFTQVQQLMRLAHEQKVLCSIHAAVDRSCRQCSRCFGGSL